MFETAVLGATGNTAGQKAESKIVLRKGERGTGGKQKGTPKNGLSVNCWVAELVRISPALVDVPVGRPAMMRWTAKKKIIILGPHAVL